MLERRILSTGQLVTGLEVLERRILSISASEGVAITEEGVRSLISVCEGDLRRAITTLQSAARLRGTEELTREHIHQITGGRGGVVAGKQVSANLE